MRCPPAQQLEDVQRLTHGMQLNSCALVITLLYLLSTMRTCVFCLLLDFGFSFVNGHTNPFNQPRPEHLLNSSSLKLVIAGKLVTVIRWTDRRDKPKSLFKTAFNENIIINTNNMYYLQVQS